MTAIFNSNSFEDDISVTFSDQACRELDHVTVKTPLHQDLIISKSYYGQRGGHVVRVHTVGCPGFSRLCVESIDWQVLANHLREAPVTQERFPNYRNLQKPLANNPSFILAIIIRMAASHGWSPSMFRQQLYRMALECPNDRYPPESLRISNTRLFLRHLKGRPELYEETPKPQEETHMNLPHNSNTTSTLSTKAHTSIAEAINAGRQTRSSNVRKAALLAMSDYYTVMVAFDLRPLDSVDPNDLPQLYTYLVNERLNLATGDIVVVPSKTAFNLARVYAVDNPPDLNMDTADQMRWVVDRVEFGLYEEMIARDNALQDVIAQAEQQRVRAQLQAQLKDTIGESALEAATRFLKGPEKVVETSQATPVEVAQA